AALLLPALIRAKQQAQGAQCMSNLRQLCTGWKMYSGDNQDLLAPNGDESQQPANLSDPSYPQWCPGRQDLYTELSPSYSLANVGGQWIRKGLIYPYVANTAVYLCPADTSSLPVAGTQYPHVRSMSMNTWLSPIKPWNNTTTVVSYYTEASLIKPGPANLWVFIDENPVGIKDGSFVCLPGSPNWIDCPASYHNTAGGMVFGDGHAEIHKWRDGTVLQGFAAKDMANGGYGNPNFIQVPPAQSPPTDLNWLQSVSTIFVNSVRSKSLFE